MVLSMCPWWSCRCLSLPLYILASRTVRCDRTKHSLLACFCGETCCSTLYPWLCVWCMEERSRDFTSCELPYMRCTHTRKPFVLLQFHFIIAQNAWWWWAGARSHLHPFAYTHVPGTYRDQWNRHGNWIKVILIVRARNETDCYVSCVFLQLFFNDDSGGKTLRCHALFCLHRKVISMHFFIVFTARNARVRARAWIKMRRYAIRFA